MTTAQASNSRASTLNDFLRSEATPEDRQVFVDLYESYMKYQFLQNDRYVYPYNIDFSLRCVLNRVMNRIRQRYDDSGIKNSSNSNNKTDNGNDGNDYFLPPAYRDLTFEGVLQEMDSMSKSALKQKQLPPEIMGRLSYYSVRDPYRFVSESSMYGDFYTLQTAIGTIRNAQKGVEKAYRQQVLNNMQMEEQIAGLSQALYLQEGFKRKFSQIVDTNN